MDSTSDPSDWLQTELPPLFQLDSMLRCHICKDFMKAPVLTACDHCFCSVCIRRVLSTNAQCPLCQEEQYESQLRKVLIFDETVSWFNKWRQELFEKLQRTRVETVHAVEKSRPVTASSTTKSSGTISQFFNKARKIEKPKYKPQKPKVSAELVECPVCSEFMTLDELQGVHIDECLSGKTPESSNSSVAELVEVEPRKLYKFDQSGKHQVQVPTNMARIAKPDFNSMSMTKLREKMNAYGVPVTGSRYQMERRFTEFTVLYNANLDSLHPVPVKTLLNKLWQWDALQNQVSEEVEPDSEARKDNKNARAERKRWRKEHRGEYADLIKRARKNMITDKSGPAGTDLSGYAGKKREEKTEQPAEEPTEESTEEFTSEALFVPDE